MKSWLIIGGALVTGFVLMTLGGHGNDPVGQVPMAVDGEVTNAGHGEQQNDNGRSGDQADYSVLIDDDEVLGNPDARVTIVEFGDYQCSFCTRFYNDTLPVLREKYIETGQVNMVFRDMAINGKESINAALASECAADQGAFWEYHDKLFEERKGYNVGIFIEDKLVSFAEDLGLNGEQLRQCYTSGTHQNEITKDRSDGQRFGARGTPTFFINGRLAPGAQPLGTFEKIIAEELARN